ncbi:MAG: glycosyltransferase [Halioglobus sp.]
MENSAIPPAQLTVSIVLFNSCVKLLKNTLNSLQIAALRAVEDGLVSGVSVDLVDNSSDMAYRDSVLQILAAFQDEQGYQVRYRALENNLGFGGGNNTVNHSLNSDFHLILNPDVELADDAISTALSRLEDDPGIVLLSPHVSSGSGSQEFLCKRYPSVLVLLVRAFAPDIVGRFFRRQLEDYEMRDLCTNDTETDVVLASGAFMLVRTKALLAVGGFDESYFLYFEDFDLSLRLAHFGRLVFYPATKIVHHGGYAASKGWRHMSLFIKSGFRFFNTHSWRWI